MLTYQNALAQLLGSVHPVATERVGIDDATGRVIAEDLVSHHPMPAFDYSAMDGYAVCTTDLVGAGPWNLLVIGESAAGGQLPSLAPGSACRIFTGAPIPPGADAVLPQENVQRTSDVIRIDRAPKPLAHIRRRGEDVAEGTTLIHRGTRLTPGHAALAAALDRAFVLVARRPVVTVLSSGNELRWPGQPGRPGSIAESNGIFVASSSRRAGAFTRIGAYVPDDLIVARDAVVEALRGSDLVVTIGGVSVGDHDVMRTAFEAAGVTLDFWRVAIKPGKPIAVGRFGQTHVIGLPGNPASASLTWLLFGAPVVRSLQGDANPLPARYRVEVAGALKGSPGREEFVRAKLEAGPRGMRAKLLQNQASGAVMSFARADALVIVPMDTERVEDGSTLDMIRIDEC